MSELINLLAARAGLSDEASQFLACLDSYLGDRKLDDSDREYLGELVKYVARVDAQPEAV